MSPLIPVTSTVERAIGSRRYTIAAWTEDGEADSSGNRMSGQELAVQAEVLGHRRTPAVERVRLGEVARFPRALLGRSEEHTSELQSHHDLVCRLLLEKKKKKKRYMRPQYRIR